MFTETRIDKERILEVYVVGPSFSENGTRRDYPLTVQPCRAGPKAGKQGSEACPKPGFSGGHLRRPDDRLIRGLGASFRALRSSPVGLQKGGGLF